MDFISNKIKYSNIRAARENVKLQDLTFSEDYSIVLDLDANIEIIINNDCVFHCSMIPILELYLQLKKWRIQQNNSNFSYVSLESSRPIFEIENKNNKWYFISEFNMSINMEININDIKIIIDDFINDFEQNFNEIFNFKITNLMKNYL